MKPIKQHITNEKVLLEVYRLIGLNIKNKNYENGSIADEIINNSIDELDDLVNLVFEIFMKRKHKPIKYINAYVKKFCHGVLIDRKKYNIKQDILKNRYLVLGWGKIKEGDKNEKETKLSGSECI